MGKYVSRYGNIQAALEAMGLKSPHVAYVNGASNTDGLVYVNVGDNKEIVFEDNGSGEISGENAALKTPFHFIALENSNVALTNKGNNAPNVEYSYDKNTWTQWDYSALSLNAGEKLYFRGDNPDGFSTSGSVYSTFNISGSVDAAGNFNSLVNTDLSSETTIGQYCFYRLFYQQNAVKNVNAYITYISFAFCGCYSLSSFVAPNLTYAGYSGFENCSSLSSFEAPNVSYVSTNAFSFCTSLSSFKAPNLTYVGYNAFKNCSSLSSFEAPNVSYVGDVALLSCTSLSSFEAPNLTYISDGAFAICSSLSSFEAPNLTYVGYSAFEYVAQSTTDGCDFIFGNINPPQIQSNTFNGAKIHSIQVPASVVDTYKTATNWTTVAQYITAIS